MGLLHSWGELFSLLLIFWPPVGSVDASIVLRVAIMRQRGLGFWYQEHHMEAGKVVRVEAWEKDVGACEFQRL